MHGEKSINYEHLKYFSFQVFEITNALGCVHFKVVNNDQNILIIFIIFQR